MNIRLACARFVGSCTTWLLRKVLHRPAATLPGSLGVHIDPNLIADLRNRIREDCIVVVGTNGKTTVTNMIADSFEACGKTVICNRTGANLSSGVASALMHAKSADWAVIESDELWFAQVLPQLQADYAVLLNLFRDQLDRMGEIDHLQESIVKGLSLSPKTKLVYNADDPLCQAIASRVQNECIAFGLDEDLNLAQNTVSDASICPHCGSMLDYRWRQYGQLGNYTCPNCGKSRPELAFAARDIEFEAQSMAFLLSIAKCNEQAERVEHLNVPFSSAYMLYNIVAVRAVTSLCALPRKLVESAIAVFDPKNGRLQTYEIGGHKVLLNLAKNPVGFNQNLKIIARQEGPKAVAFFINDNVADGHDVSWLWDVDFQELAGKDDVIAFAGGIRKNDMQVRLKYAGVKAALVDNAADFLAQAQALSPSASFYLIANYTALPQVKAELDSMSSLPEPKRAISTPRSQERPAASAALAGEHLKIVHMYPDLLNLYGDGGNVTILAQRARQRGIEAEVMRITHGQAADLSDADIVFLGGGPDREQYLAAQNLQQQAQTLRAYIEDDGVLLAICGGYQIIGREWLFADKTVDGLGLVDITTVRASGDSHNRIVGNIVLSSSLAAIPVVGYENHAGRTLLGACVKPFGHVVGACGKGNDDTSGADGVLYRNVVGTYLHGPLLSKNPEIADSLIERALARQASKQGRPAPALVPLDDAEERAANAAMCARLGVS